MKTYFALNFITRDHKIHKLLLLLLAFLSSFLYKFSIYFNSFNDINEALIMTSITKL